MKKKNANYVFKISCFLRFTTLNTNNILTAWKLELSIYLNEEGEREGVNERYKRSIPFLWR